MDFSVSVLRFVSSAMCATGLLSATNTVSGAPRPAGTERGASERIINCGNSNLCFAPYVWKRIETNSTVQMEATMPGAYLKAEVQGTTTLGLLVDGWANLGCPTSSMPVVEYSIDRGPFKIVQLSRTGAIYTLPLATGLNPTNRHHLELYFRAAEFFQTRSRAHSLRPGSRLTGDREETVL